MTCHAGFYAYMTTSMADRSDASTWGSRQPPPRVHACDKGDRDIMTTFTSSSDARTELDVRRSRLGVRVSAFGRRPGTKPNAERQTPRPWPAPPPCTWPG